MANCWWTLFDAACGIIDDYERYGEVLQVDANGEYEETTAIFKLQEAVDNIIKIVKDKGINYVDMSELWNNDDR